MIFDAVPSSRVSAGPILLLDLLFAVSFTGLLIAISLPGLLLLVLRFLVLLGFALLLAIPLCMALRALSLHPGRGQVGACLSRIDGRHASGPGCDGDRDED